MIGALIVAAGLSSRMQGIDKILMPIDGVPVITRTCRVFQASDAVDKIVVVGSKENITKIRSVLPSNEFTKVAAVVEGGEIRPQSVLNGLKELSDCEYVMIHDGARPFVTEEIIATGLDAVKKFEAVCCGIPATDTIKLVEEGVVQYTLNRKFIWNAQTPQVFRYDLIMDAYKDADLENVTDDATLVEKMGHVVVMFKGSKENIKITDQNDIAMCDAIIRSRKNK